MTPINLIRLALQNSGALSLSQTIFADDLENAFSVLNFILTEWQLNRWIVYDLVDQEFASSGATSYTVGPGGDFDFTGQRPDKVDAVYASKDGEDFYLFPFMSRESYDRVSMKANTGIPEAFFYDATLSTLGTVFLYPVPDDTYTIHVQAKGSLGQLTALTQSISLPAIYSTALTWNLAAQLRPLYGLPDDSAVSTRAAMSLQAMVNSIAQVPTNLQPQASNRGGIYSTFAGGQNDNTN